MSNSGQRNFDLLMTKISKFVEAVDKANLQNANLDKLKNEAIEALKTLYGVLGWPLEKPAPTEADLAATARATETESDLQRCTGGVPWS